VKEPLLDWEEDKPRTPSLEPGLDSAGKRKMEQSSPPAPEPPGSAQSHGCLWLTRAGARVPSSPQGPPAPSTCCTGGCARASCQVKLGPYFGHSRGQKLPGAEHRSQVLVLELINLAGCV